MASHPQSKLPPEKLMREGQRSAINRRNGRKGAQKRKKK